MSWSLLWRQERRGCVVTGWTLAVVCGVAGATASQARAQARPGPAATWHDHLSARERSVPLVLDQVTVIDVEHGARWRRRRVVLEGNRIRALGSVRTVRLPPGARVVHARGKYLIPGLWDMHIHPAAEAPPAGYRVADAIYRQLVANGVTGIRDAGAAAPLDTLHAWKREIAAGQRVGPRMIVSGPSINTPGLHPDPGCTTATRSQCGREAHYLYVLDTADARHLVDSIHAAGADMLKIHDVPRPIWFALAAEARRVGLRFGGHVASAPDSGPPLNGLIASDSGALILDHKLYANLCGDLGDTVLSLVRCTAAVTRLRHNGTWVTFDELGNPALSGPQHHLPKAFVRRALRYSSLDGPPAKGESLWQPLTAAERRALPTAAEWATAWAVNGDSATTVRGCQVARLAYAADLPWLANTDWPMGPPPGVGLHLQLLGPVACGVPALWVLQGATLNPARTLGLTDSLGTVAAGKVADLVLLDGDPLEDIANVTKIAAVVANGRYFDRAALDRLLVEAAEEWRQACAHGCD